MYIHVQVTCLVDFMMEFFCECGEEIRSVHSAELVGLYYSTVCAERHVQCICMYS